MINIFLLLDLKTRAIINRIKIHVIGWVKKASSLEAM